MMKKISISILILVSVLLVCCDDKRAEPISFSQNGSKVGVNVGDNRVDSYILRENLKICLFRIRYDNGNRGTDCGTSQVRGWTRNATYTWNELNFGGQNLLASPQTFTTTSWGDHFNLTTPTLNSELASNTPPVQHTWTWFTETPKCWRIWQTIASDEAATKYETWQLSVSPTNGRPDYEITMYPQIISFGTAYVTKEYCYSDCELQEVRYWDGETEISGNILSYLAQESGLSLSALQTHYTETTILDEFKPVGEACPVIPEDEAPSCNILVQTLCDDTNDDGNPDGSFIRQINICTYADGSIESAVEEYELAGYGDPDTEVAYEPVKVIICDRSACSGKQVCDAKGNVLIELDCGAGNIIHTDVDGNIVVPAGEVGSCDNCDLIESDEYCDSLGVVSYVREVTECGNIFWRDLEGELFKKRPDDAQLCIALDNCIIVCDSLGVQHWACKTANGTIHTDFDGNIIEEGVGAMWTMFSKLEPPHPDAATYPASFIHIGEVTAGVHPGDATGDTNIGNITGYQVYAACSDTKPVDDSNNSIWLSGAPASFAGVSFDRVNDNPACGGDLRLSLKNCQCCESAQTLVECSSVSEEACYRLQFSVNILATGVVDIRALDGSLIQSILPAQFDDWLLDEGFTNPSRGVYEKCVAKSELFWLDANGNTQPSISDYTVGGKTFLSMSNVRGSVTSIVEEEITTSYAEQTVGCNDDRRDMLLEQNNDLLQQMLIELQKDAPDFGEAFTVAPSDWEQFYRTDLKEEFRYDPTIGRWIGEVRSDGFGDGGTAASDQYLRRFNGMLTAEDAGIVTPFDIIITDASFNWDTPDASTGSVTLQRDGVAVFTINWVGSDEAIQTGLGLIVPTGSVISAQLGVLNENINNSQYYFEFRRIEN